MGNALQGKAHLPVRSLRLLRIEDARWRLAPTGSILGLGGGGASVLGPVFRGCSSEVIR